ncbi:MAG: hypothetical protein H0T64_04560 [Pyrinomonadaceae bacterium]|nr:hypothetical protein [Pyrinomonadaceae bacterium]MDQ3175862.1 hypothetical protein [Acidobacteriota bacterium]
MNPPPVTAVEWGSGPALDFAFAVPFAQVIAGAFPMGAPEKIPCAGALIRRLPVIVREQQRTQEKK